MGELCGDAGELSRPAERGELARKSVKCESRENKMTDKARARLMARLSCHGRSTVYTLMTSFRAVMLPLHAAKCQSGLHSLPCVHSATCPHIQAMKKNKYIVLNHSYISGRRFLNVLEQAKKIRRSNFRGDDLHVVDKQGRLAAIVRWDIVELVLLGKTVQYSFSKWGV